MKNIKTQQKSQLFPFIASPSLVRKVDIHNHSLVTYLLEPIRKYVSHRHISPYIYLIPSNLQLSPYPECTKIRVKLGGKERQIELEGIFSIHLYFQHLLIVWDLKLHQNYCWDVGQTGLALLLLLAFHFINDLYNINKGKKEKGMYLACERIGELVFWVFGQESKGLMFVGFEGDREQMFTQFRQAMPQQALKTMGSKLASYNVDFTNIIINQTMKNYNEQKYCDLPLQTRPFFDNHPQDRKKEDRPKQINQDVYRLQSEGKENRIKPTQVSNKKQTNKEQGEVCTKAVVERAESKGVEECKFRRNENLRSIIKKQLFSNEKAISSKLNYLHAETFEEKRKVEKKGVNMYQRLLCQVYGQPKLSKNKSLKKVQKPLEERPDNPMKRQDSTTTLTKPKPNPLLRYQSQSILQPLSAAQLAPSSSKYSQKPKIRELTYLQLYLQKRKPLLFL